MVEATSETSQVKRVGIRLDPAKVAQKAREIAEIVEDGHEFIERALSAEDMADIENRS